MTKRILLYLLIFCSFKGVTQKYNFVNWTVEDGLIQSQASSICQDKYRQLWIGTEGGISRFDGKKFTGYTIQDDLVANQINEIMCDKDGNLWLATNLGISVFNGRKFKTIKTGDAPVNNISSVIQLNNGDIYALSNYDLIQIRDFKSKKITISNDSLEKITCIYYTNTYDLVAAVYKKGLYILKNGNWKQLCTVNEPQAKLLIRKIFISSKNDTLLCTNKGLYQLLKNKVTRFEFNSELMPENNVFCVAEDSQKNLWLGTENGCLKFEENKIMFFDEKSGFTDNSVNQIFKDAENNLWFATNGDGIYKFRENTFTYYDKSSGLSNTIVMGVTQTKDKTIYAAGYGGGFYKINTKNAIEPVVYKGRLVIGDSKINCLFADDENNVWIGTLNKGTYVYNEKKGLQKIELKNNPNQTLNNVTTFLKDNYGNILIGTNHGLFLRDKEENISLLKSASPFITSLEQFDENNVLIGTSKGIFLLDKNYLIVPYNEKEFGNASVLCLSKNRENIWIGTTDKGVFNWNYKTGKTINYTTADGLPSNFIYSIDVSDFHKAWIGTGFGISNLQLNDEGKILAIKNYGRSDGLLGMECNHNCLLRSLDSSLWFGTTKGLFHFNPSTNITGKNQPLVLLRSVKLFSSTITDSTLFKNPDTWFNAPTGLSLSSKQNHLTFELGAIYFTNPDDVLYKYKLEGIDKDYTTTYNPYIIYPSLPPGKYTLNVSGLTKSGAISINQILYSFEIKKAFYQTRFFQVVIIFLLIGTGALIAYFFTRGKQKRKQREKEILEKIREEEFVKLRQRTAEDFHDEMGNSLTRISLLTDILKTKINGKEEDIKNLVIQIKENTAALYSGSKDIIWSLNSQNDGLYEIIEHVKDIGTELFQETNIDFKYFHDINRQSNLKLKLDYSRNLTMIFKEAYSNILKHSKADKVIIKIHLNDLNSLEVLINDNGVGYIEKSLQNGNGLKNMKNRANRMNGNMTINTVMNKGTELRFYLKDIFIQ